MSISAFPVPVSSPHSKYNHRRSKASPTIAKPTISPPISARPSRQSSTSSISSSYSSRSISSSPHRPTIDLSSRATTILSTLYNTHTPSALTPYIHPSAHFTHEYIDEQTCPDRSSYIAHWESKLARFPAFQATQLECAVDETQGKVWVVSDVVCDQEGLKRRQVVDMLTFDAEGLLVEGNGFFRRMSAD